METIGFPSRSIHKYSKFKQLLKPWQLQFNLNNKNWKQNLLFQYLKLLHLKFWKGN